MGTRGLVGVMVDGDRKAMYNHWDSYPEGLGVEVMKFVQNKLDDDGIEKLKAKVRGVEVVDKNGKATREQIQKYKRFADTGVSTRELSEWYVLLRDLQGVAWITEVFDGNLGHVTDGTAFIKDSLFCEYAYYVNLDTGMVDFYVGFQNGPDPDGEFGQDISESCGTDYYPCKKVGSVSFQEIRDCDDYMKILNKIFPGEEEE